MILRAALSLLICTLFLGIKAQAQSNSFGIGVILMDHVDQERGVVVVGLEPGSPAQQFLEIGDIINEIDGEFAHDPEFFSLFIGEIGFDGGSGVLAEFTIEKSIGRLYREPETSKIYIPVFYHGGTYNYQAYRNPLPNFFAGILEGVTYKFGAEAFCSAELAMRIATGQQISASGWMNICVREARKYLTHAENVHPEAFKLGVMTGGVFFSIRDAIVGDKGKWFGKKGLGACANNVAGEGLDALIWMQRENVQDEILYLVEKGMPLDRVIERAKRDAQFAVGAGVFQCVIRKKR
ncbi:MAG: hypothetical protein AAFN91_00850 [Pseudomonadota bacterium]